MRRKTRQPTRSIIACVILELGGQCTTIAVRISVGHRRSVLVSFDDPFREPRKLRKDLTLASEPCGGRSNPARSLGDEWLEVRVEWSPIVKRERMGIEPT